MSRQVLGIEVEMHGLVTRPEIHAPVLMDVEEDADLKLIRLCKSYF